MALDGLFLYCLADELINELTGCKLDKIYQISRYELLLCFRSRTDSKRLLISASGNAPRIHLTDKKYDNPEKPPMLTMLLRKNLAGAVLSGLRQEKTDRVLFLDFDATNEIGDRVKRTLAVEIMAQYSNIILLDENSTVIDSVKRVDLLRSSVRQILPGIKYALPPNQKKISLIFDGADAVANAAASIEEKTKVKSLLFAAEGMSPVLCREMVFRSADGKLAAELELLHEQIESKNITPTAVFDSDGKPIDFSFTDLTQYAGNDVRHYSTLSELLDEYYFEHERAVRAKARAEDLFRAIDNIIERITKKLSVQEIELKAAADREQKKIFGDLINANLYRLEKGAFFYDLENFYSDMESVRIPADARLTPAQNAQKYYKEYRKAATAEKILKEQLEKGAEELEYILSVRDALTRADSEKEFSAIRDELAGAGFLKKKSDRGGKKRPITLPFNEYVSPNGFRVAAGKNNIQNDLLTHKTAAKNDIWFHTQKFHGSHVILFTDGREPQTEDYLFAAKTAVENSEAKGSSKIPVDYTAVKNIKKPTGAKPGFVIYHVYKTIII